MLGSIDRCCFFVLFDFFYFALQLRYAAFEGGLVLSFDELLEVVDEVAKSVINFPLFFPVELGEKKH